MVTSAISNHVASVLPQLSLGRNLFTEFGRTTPSVVINLTTQGGDENIRELRYASVNIILRGYGAIEGVRLATQVVNVILELEGVELENPHNAAEKYKFHSITARMWPTPFSAPEGHQISSNLDINFKELGG